MSDSANPEPVRFGIDCVIAGAERLPDGPLGMLTNDAARLSTDASMRSRAALVHAGVEIARLFSPEHGIGAIADDGSHVDDGRDPVTGVELTSLYGERLAPTVAQLAGLRAIVVDLPDAGTRFYTYAWTMTHMLDACAATGIPVIVLDRPNPLGGDMSDAEGPLLDDAHHSLLGRARVPIRHSLTIGEFAQWWQQERLPALDLRVVRCAHWSRAMHWVDTDLPFVPMSPALTSYETAICYPGVCLFEATNVSVGRGTDTPFRQLSAPWLDAARIADHCQDSERLRGISLEARGSILQLNVRDRGTMRPVRAGVTLLGAIRTLHRDDFRWATYPTVANPTGEGHLERLVGTSTLRTLLDSGAPVPDAFFSTDDWARRTRAARLYDPE